MWRKIKLIEMLKLTSNLRIHKNILLRSFCTPSSAHTKQDYGQFETVFSFPYIKYFAQINRLKVYSILGSSVIIPVCGTLELLNYIPSQTVFAAAYIGATSTALLSLVSYPFKNIIGFLYITEDNKYIKISSLTYWGNRNDKIIPVDDWTPILEMEPKPTDALYLTPQLADGSKYKMLVKFGTVHNAYKMGTVLE